MAMRINFKKFLLTGIVVALSFPFVSGLIGGFMPQLTGFAFFGTTVAQVIGAGVAVFLTDWLLANVKFLK